MKCLLCGLAFLMLPVTAGAQSVLSDDQLAGMRGGLMTPSGIAFGFGAVIRTYIDGKMALQTDLTWTDRGAITTSSAGGAETVLPGINGTTVVLHDIDARRITSLVLNTADGRDIRQDTAVVLNIPQLEHYKADAAVQGLAANLRDAVTSAFQQTGR